MACHHGVMLRRPNDRERPDARVRPGWRWVGLIVLVVAVLFSLFTSVQLVRPAAGFAVLVAAVAAAVDIERATRSRRR